jgi:imidazolonepropionase-like amidohydrolase
MARVFDCPRETCVLVVETLLLGERGTLAPAYAPLAGTLPAQIERGFKAGGLAPPADLSRERRQQSFAKLQALVLELKKLGLPVLAGTDGLGIELVRERELNVQAGMTPAEALASATIIPATTFHVGGETGSIEVVNRAELVLINGDPSKDIGELRQVEIVLQGERLMSAQDLRTAIGISRPAHRLR